MSRANLFKTIVLTGLVTLMPTAVFAQKKNNQNPSNKFRVSQTFGAQTPHSFDKQDFKNLCFLSDTRIEFVAATGTPAISGIYFVDLTAHTGTYRNEKYGTVTTMREPLELKEQGLAVGIGMGVTIDAKWLDLYATMTPGWFFIRQSEFFNFNDANGNFGFGTESKTRNGFGVRGEIGASKDINDIIAIVLRGGVCIGEIIDTNSLGISGHANIGLLFNLTNIGKEK